MERKPRCYFAGSSQMLDTSKANLFGDVFNLFEDEASSKNIYATSAQAYHIKKRLSDAISSDYLIIGGRTASILIAFAILYEKFGFVNILLFSSKDGGEYIPRCIPKHQLI